MSNLSNIDLLLVIISATLIIILVTYFRKYYLHKHSEFNKKNKDCIKAISFSLILICIISISISIKLYAYDTNSITKPKLLSIPTYDSNPSVGHPGIEYIPQGFKGYKYWLTYTPFPDESRENPCIAVSNDGETWTTPSWSTNPLATQADAVEDGLSYNSDPEILLMHDGKIGLYYRAFKANPKREVIYLMTLSTDDSKFSARQAVIDTSDTVLSPTVVAEEDGTYTMYTANDTNKIQKRTSNDGIHWSNPNSCNLSTGNIVNAWHIAVKKYNGIYYLLVDASESSRKLYLYTSADGVNFTGSTIPFVKSSNSGWDNRGYYRSTFLILGDNPLKLFVFLTGEDGSGSGEYKDIWKIGSEVITKRPILSNKSSNNLLKNPELSNGTDDVANSFTSLVHSGITASFKTDSNSQRIDINKSTVITSASIQQTVNVVSGTSYNASSMFKTIGNVGTQINVDWYNGATYLSTSTINEKNSSSTDWDLMDYGKTLVAPNSATKAQISLMVLPNEVGDTGSAWFKDVIFKPSS